MLRGLFRSRPNRVYIFLATLGATTFIPRGVVVDLHLFGQGQWPSTLIIAASGSIVPYLVVGI